MSLPEMSTPTAFSFPNDQAAVAEMKAFDFGGGRNQRWPEGWVVVRIDENVWISEVIFCPPCIVDSWKSLNATLAERLNQFPDSLVTRVWPHQVEPRSNWTTWLPSCGQYFQELRALRAKPAPWLEDEYLNAEAALAGNGFCEAFSHIQSYRRDELAQAARRGREPAEIASAQRRVRKLMNLSYQAADALRTSMENRKRKSFTAETSYELESEEWMKRLRVECPGFSEAIYKGAMESGWHDSR